MKFFQNESKEWFIDLPEYLANGGALADCQMVEGADKMLDVLSDGQSVVTIDVLTDDIENRDEDNVVRLEFIELTRPFEGANYQASFRNLQMKIWLCGVTKYVFGDFPATMIFRKSVLL